ncbi:MAG: hypothetical protein IPM06_18870 [Rhizobiales bacterium]|nr:hypothetical protein [Hyphomicrobiales bacterium]
MSAMSFLQLAQRLREKCRISGTGPSSVIGQTGEMLRVVNWINDAWLDIQEARPNWKWMQGDVIFNTVVQQATYTPAQCSASDMASWDFSQSWRIYSGSSENEQFLDVIPYSDWRDTYMFGSMRTSYSQPVAVAETPSGGLAFGQIPDAIYTVDGKYFKEPSALVNNADTPGMPDKFHLMIVYRAMMFYASSEIAPEVYQEGLQEFRRMMSRLERDQLDPITISGTIA